MRIEALNMAYLESYAHCPCAEKSLIWAGNIFLVGMRIGETHSTPYPHLFGSIALSLMTYLGLRSQMASHGTKSNLLSWSQSPSLIGPCLPHRPCFICLPLAHSFIATSVICVCLFVYLFAFQTRLTCFSLRLFRLTAQNILFLDVHLSGFLLLFRSQCKWYKCHLFRKHSLATQSKILESLYTLPNFGSLENSHLALSFCLGVAYLPFGISVTGGRTLCILFSLRVYNGAQHRDVLSKYIARIYGYIVSVFDGGFQLVWAQEKLQITAFPLSLELESKPDTLHFYLTVRQKVMY